MGGFGSGRYGGPPTVESGLTLDINRLLRHRNIVPGSHGFGTLKWSNATQNDVGLMYKNGRGGPRDYAEALKWFKKAADQDYNSAQYNLGQMYVFGRGVPQDDAEAVKWYRKAADQGYAEAQLNLGICYMNGQGIPQDRIAVHMWLNLAASRLSAAQQELRAEAIADRDQISKLMTAGQIAEAQRLAREWRPK